MTSEGPGFAGEPKPEAGEILRPEAVVLGDEAIIPASNFIRPPPNRFTHDLAVDEPYKFEHPMRTDDQPDGILRAGTPVVLLVEGDDRCRVVDGRGLYVEVRRSSLRERGVPTEHSRPR